MFPDRSGLAFGQYRTNKSLRTNPNDILKEYRIKINQNKT